MFMLLRQSMTQQRLTFQLNVISCNNNTDDVEKWRLERYWRHLYLFPVEMYVAGTWRNIKRC